MSNLLTRSISGAVFGAILIFSILFSEFTFTGVFFILMLLCLMEFKKMIGLKNPLVYFIATFIFTLSASFNITDSAYEYNVPKIILAFIIVSIFSSFISLLFSKEKNTSSELGKLFLTIAYLAIPFSLILQIGYINPDLKYQSSTILGILLLTWTNDTFAFLVGKNFGKHKLLERISPKKTIEGFIGGFLACITASYFIAQQFTSLSVTNWMVIAVIVSIFGVLGDLIESMFKRQAKIKDSGNLIPGHGGFLDRMDSLIFAAPFIYIYLHLIQ